MKGDRYQWTEDVGDGFVTLVEMINEKEIVILEGYNAADRIGNVEFFTPSDHTDFWKFIGNFSKSTQALDFYSRIK